MLVGVSSEGRPAVFADVEVELDHLPVALVQVVPVVEGVEVPVLQRQLAWDIRLRGDVRVRDDRPPLGHAPRPLARTRSPDRGRRPGNRGGSRRDPGEVLPGGCDLDEVGPAPRPTQRDGRIREQQTDVHGQIRRARPALPIGREPEHRREALGERCLIGEARERGRRSASASRAVASAAPSAARALMRVSLALASDDAKLASGPLSARPDAKVCR